MSGVFKKFRKGDIEITPFQANKEYLVHVSNYTGSYFEKGYEQSVIKDFTQTASAQGTDIRIVSLSIFAYDSQYDGTDFMPNEFGSYLNVTTSSPHAVTTNGYFKRSIHDSLQGMYYTNPDDPTKTLDNSGYEKEIRSLGETAQVLSVPQRIFGESIKKGTVLIKSGSKTLKDDTYGNLLDVSQFITSASESISYSSRSLMTVDFTRDLYNRKGKTISAHSINALASSSYYRDNGKEYYDLSNKTRFFERSGFSNRVELNNVTIQEGSAATDKVVGFFDGITPSTTHSRTLTETQSIMITKDAGQFDLRFDDDYSVFIRCSASIDHAKTAAVAAANPGEDLQIILSKRDPHGKAGFPFEIGVTNNNHSTPGRFIAKVSNGIETKEIVATSVTGIRNLVLTKTGNTYTFYRDNVSQGSATFNPVQGGIHNKGDIIVGAVAHDSGKYEFDKSTRYGRRRRPITQYKGHARFGLSNIMIFSQSLSTAERTFVQSNPNFENKVGNVFYNHGIITLTNEGDGYQNVTQGGMLSECTLSFKNTHTIIEHEYNCHVKEREYGFTMNPTIVSQSKYGIVKSFTTGSEWSPYVTTIGLYDDNARLVAVGKLSRPIRKSNEYDTTFVVSFDT